MPARLVEQYRVGDAVHIHFSDDSGERWLSGIVALLQHPGVWVRVHDGSLWYVTNGRRIRPCSDASGEETEPP